ncbi:uncharacterized protein KQ657_000464 [Scheffersomyces spartinae]|uniref:Geranylgeranyl transferase type-2 subunit beta n=1 Tax=Scheffersomyces spartinae TaxID=45513 RepID=A0A9P7V9M6_9ASCO|nr:uncharacterized protein KQ657_000464 [Scheffersomyces spartinae]KAG7193772.1 hypothetical protein KQ657_000464 [Scheffersomyces spartinae]
MALVKEKHIQFIKSLNDDVTEQMIEYWLSEHLRLNGIYWGLTAVLLLQEPSTLDQQEVIKFVLKCWDLKQGGFAPFPRHDAHMLSTLSGIQILANYGAWDVLNEKKQDLVKFIKGLQLPNGSFQGDRFGEVDTRFSYNAVSSLAILGELTKDVTEPALEFVLRCQNFDGGFGMVPGAESHAAQVFTCIGFLAITDNLHHIDVDKIGSWLSDRQVESGGLNGRPEKLPDVCYSWWVLSSLAMIGKAHWIDFDKLEQYILSCQDTENGGISDRPDNECDVFHTCFGLTGLSLMNNEKYSMLSIDPIYCMPKEVTKKFDKWKQSTT